MGGLSEESRESSEEEPEYDKMREIRFKGSVFGKTKLLQNFQMKESTEWKQMKEAVDSEI